jgi:hypothetical protein
LSIKKEQLEWRREKILYLRSTGLSYSQIAREMQISKTAVAEDMQYLREQAKQNIKEYVTEHLPTQFQICLIALDEVIKHAFYISLKSNDNREKLQAMQVFRDSHVQKLELLANSASIDAALQFIKRKQLQQQQQEQHDEQQKKEEVTSTPNNATTESDESESTAVL